MVETYMVSGSEGSGILSARRIWESVFVTVFLVLILSTCESGNNGERGNENHDTSRGSSNVSTDSANGDTLAAPVPLTAIGEDVRELGIDLLGYNACRFLKDRIFVLSAGEGASDGGGSAPAVGGLWLDSCFSSEVDSHHVRITLSGLGWKWISRKRTPVGAEFELSENVKFRFEGTATGTIDLSYNPERHVASAYFVPTSPLDVSFQVAADIDVETEELWGSIVGTAAAVIGASPEERARKSIRKKGAMGFRTRLDRGFTMIYDLCTGHSYNRFGSFPPGRIPGSATPYSGINYLASGTARLHTKSLIMLGPYTSKETLVGYAELQNGEPVSVEWVCRAEAEKVMRAYVNNRPIPESESIRGGVVSSDEAVTMTVPAGQNCPMVLMMTPASEDTTASEILYRIYYEGEVREPLVSCP